MTASALRAPAGAPEAEATAALLLRLRASGIRNLGVLRAIEAVPRRGFLPAAVAGWSMSDVALPIGCGQTTMRPSFVARMLEALTLAGGEHVLEIGSGSGYVTALLASLCRRVEGVERYRALAEAAEGALRRLGRGQAAITWGDGLAGVAGGFDRILVQAALPDVPPALVERLAPEGILVCGLQGPATGGSRILMRVRRATPGRLEPICPAMLPPAEAGLARVL